MGILRTGGQRGAPALSALSRFRQLFRSSHSQYYVRGTLRFINHQSLLAGEARHTDQRSCGGADIATLRHVRDASAQNPLHQLAP